MKTGAKIMLGLAVFLILSTIALFACVRIIGAPLRDAVVVEDQLEPFQYLVLENVRSRLLVDSHSKYDLVVRRDSANEWTYRYSGDTLFISPRGSHYKTRYSPQLYLGTAKLKFVRVVDCENITLNVRDENLELNARASRVYLSINGRQTQLDLFASNSSVKLSSSHLNYAEVILDHAELLAPRIERLTGTLNNGSYIQTETLTAEMVEVLDSHSKMVDSPYYVNVANPPVVDRVEKLPSSINDRQIMYFRLKPLCDNSEVPIDNLLVFSNSAVESWEGYSAGIRFSSYSGGVDLTHIQNSRVHDIPVESGQEYECWILLNVKEQEASLYVRTDRYKIPAKIFEEGEFKEKVKNLTQWNVIHNVQSTKCSMEVISFGEVSEVGEVPLIN